MSDVKNLLKKYNATLVKTIFIPFLFSLIGICSHTFIINGTLTQIIYVLNKKTITRYHFDSIDELILYRSSRTIHAKNNGAAIAMSKRTETKQAGKMYLKWNKTAKQKIVLFDELPELITDAKNREVLNSKNTVCDSNVRLFDLSSIQYFFKSKSKH